MFQSTTVVVLLWHLDKKLKPLISHESSSNSSSLAENVIGGMLTGCHAICC